jgi:hypothetical protein
MFGFEFYWGLTYFPLSLVAMLPASDGYKEDIREEGTMHWCKIWAYKFWLEP